LFPVFRSGGRSGISGHCCGMGRVAAVGKSPSVCA
jgi:hypothetical protein